MSAPSRVHAAARIGVHILPRWSRQSDGRRAMPARRRAGGCSTRIRSPRAARPRRSGQWRRYSRRGGRQRTVGLWRRWCVRRARRSPGSGSMTARCRGRSPPAPGSICASEPWSCGCGACARRRAFLAKSGIFGRLPAFRPLPRAGGRRSRNSDGAGRPPAGMTAREIAVERYGRRRSPKSPDGKQP